MCRLKKGHTSSQAPAKNCLSFSNSGFNSTFNYIGLSNTLAFLYRQTSYPLENVAGQITTGTFAWQLNDSNTSKILNENIVILILFNNIEYIAVI